MVREGIAMAKDYELGVAKALPFPLELGRVGPEKLEHLKSEITI